MNRNSGKKIVRATRDHIRWVSGLLKALANIKGSNGIRVTLRPGVGIDVILDKAAARYLNPDEFALVRFTEAGSTAAGWYVAQEVVANDPTADPPTWTVKDPGRSFGVSAGDEGEVMHPLLIAELETTESGADPVYLIKRLARPGTNSSFWIIIGAAGGGGLPAPGLQYQVLQLDGDLIPRWDWTRLSSVTP